MASKKGGSKKAAHSLEKSSEHQEENSREDLAEPKKR